MDRPPDADIGDLPADRGYRAAQPRCDLLAAVAVHPHQGNVPQLVGLEQVEQLADLGLELGRRVPARERLEPGLAEGGLAPHDAPPTALPAADVAGLPHGEPGK